MALVKVYSKEDIQKLTRKRGGENKLGDEVSFVTGDWKKDLEQSPCLFVVIGIPEDIGVRANYGRGGANTAFKPALDSFLSQQSNHFFDARSVFVLGEVMVDDLMEASEKLDTKNKEDLQQLRNLCKQVDDRVSAVVREIVALQKIPVIIGGGHNNAYGAIRGSAEALGHPLTVVNCDPHSDFRPLEGRHSGNGFSYAFNEGWLNRYALCCLHEQYNNSLSLEAFMKHPQQLFYNTYESVFVREEKSFADALQQVMSFVIKDDCGVELDLDAITNVPSSAKTSSGISPVQARQYVHRAGTALRCKYLHIAEGAPVLSHIKADNKTGKLIAYLMTDFMKAVWEARTL